MNMNNFIFSFLILSLDKPQSIHSLNEDLAKIGIKTSDDSNRYILQQNENKSVYFEALALKPSTTNKNAHKKRQKKETYKDPLKPLIMKGKCRKISENLRKRLHINDSIALDCTELIEKEQKVLHQSETVTITDTDFEFDTLTNNSNVKSTQIMENVTLNTSTRPKINRPINFKKKALKRYGNEITQPSEYPYSVLLATFNDKDENLGICSGTLLTRRWVLTAASCFVNSNQKVDVRYVLVYAGGNSKEELLRRDYAPDSQVRNTTQFHIHFKYSKNPKKIPLSNNLALVYVQDKFFYSETVNTIKLSTEPWPYEGYKDCIFTGFGRMKLSESSKNDYVRKTQILEVTYPCQCKKITDGKRFVNNNGICPRVEEDFGFCDGDIGAGLVCNGKVEAIASRYLLIEAGSLSDECDVKQCVSHECTTENTLSVFQKTCPHLRWIINYTRVFESSDVSAKCLQPKGEGHRSSVFISLVLVHPLLTVMFRG